MNTDNILKSYTFYDNRLRRLSIFGIFDPITYKLRVYVLTLSKTIGNHYYTKKVRYVLNPGTEAQDIEWVEVEKVKKGKDIFSKKYIKEAFYNFLQHKNDINYNLTPEAIHPTLLVIKSTDRTYKQDFINYCRDSFYVKETCSVLLRGSNKKMVIDCYGNSKTKDIIVDQKSLRLLTTTPEEITNYNNAINEETENYKKFNDILDIVSPRSQNNLMKN